MPIRGLVDHKKSFQNGVVVQEVDMVFQLDLGLPYITRQVLYLLDYKLLLFSYALNPMAYTAMR